MSNVFNHGVKRPRSPTRSPGEENATIKRVATDRIPIQRAVLPPPPQPPPSPPSPPRQNRQPHILNNPNVDALEPPRGMGRGGNQSLFYEIVMSQWNRRHYFNNGHSGPVYCERCGTYHE